MHRFPSDIPHLHFIKVQLLENAVNMQFGELEGSLILGFLLNPVNQGILCDLLDFGLNVLDRERSKLFGSNHLDFLVINA